MVLTNIEKRKSEQWAVARWLAYPEPKCPPWLRTTDVARPATITQGQYGKRPAQQGDVATIRVLLEHGADVNMPGNLHKASPVLLASQGCHSEAVRELVAAGADPDLRDANGASALDYTDKTLRRRKKKKEIDDRRAAQLRQEIEAALASAHGARARSDTGSLVPTTHQCSK